MTKDISSMFERYETFLRSKIAETIYNHMNSDLSFHDTREMQKFYESKLEFIRNNYSNWQSIDPSKVSDEEIRGVFRGHYINSKN